jgi:hypothetical protein
VKRGLLVLGLGVCSFFLTSLPARADYSSRFQGVTIESKEAYAKRQIEKFVRIMNVPREGCKDLPADEVEPCLIAEAQDPGRVFELVPGSVRVFPLAADSTRDFVDFLFSRDQEIAEVSFQLIHDIGGKDGRVIQEARLYIVTSASVLDKDNCADQAGFSACRMTCAYRNGTQAVAGTLGSPEGRFYALTSCHSLHMSYRDLWEPISLAHTLVPDDSYPKAAKKTREGDVELNISAQ